MFVSTSFFFVSMLFIHVFVCILQIVINILEHVPNMTALMIGRILGGISTSLLFSAFESWMVSEHRKRGFPEHLLSSTFSAASWGNGITAIAAGFAAQLASGECQCPAVLRDAVNSLCLHMNDICI